MSPPEEPAQSSSPSCRPDRRRRCSCSLHSNDSTRLRSVPATSCSPLSQLKPPSRCTNPATIIVPFLPPSDAALWLRQTAMHSPQQCRDLGHAQGTRARTTSGQRPYLWPWPYRTTPLCSRFSFQAEPNLNLASSPLCPSHLLPSLTSLIPSGKHLPTTSTHTHTEPHLISAWPC